MVFDLHERPPSLAECVAAGMPTIGSPFSHARMSASSGGLAGSCHGAALGADEQYEEPFGP